MLEQAKKYYETFGGFKVSDYALKYGRLDYATMSKTFDCVLCNNITQIDESIFDNLISGDLEYSIYYFNNNEIDKEEYERLMEELETLEELEEPTQEQEERLEELNNGLEEDFRQNEIFQWFIVSDNAKYVLQQANELLLYSDLLDCYVWGVDHYGTSWDYVLTSIPLQERE